MVHVPEESYAGDVAKIAGIMLAEHLRIQISTVDEKYKPDFGFLAQDPLGAKNASDLTALKNSVLATQHALVDYIAEEGKSLPGHRGAAFLTILKDDLSGDLQNLLFKKMSSLQERRLEGTRGEVIRIKPDYTPR